MSKTASKREDGPGAAVFHTSGFLIMIAGIYLLSLGLNWEGIAVVWIGIGIGSWPLLKLKGGSSE